jgi:DNA topoisomerase IB
VISIDDQRLLPVIGRLKRRRSGGDRLLAWKRKDGWVDVTSSDINEYIKSVAGDDFSAKDFRTWSATVMAAVGLAAAAENSGTGTDPQSARRKAKRVNRVVREVADAIGDTPAVCRSSYIDPAVVDRFEQGRTVRRAVAETAERNNGHADAEALEGIERAVLRLLSR